MTNKDPNDIMDMETYSESNASLRTRIESLEVRVRALYIMVIIATLSIAFIAFMLSCEQQKDRSAIANRALLHNDLADSFHLHKEALDKVFEGPARVEAIGSPDGE